MGAMSVPPLAPTAYERHAPDSRLVRTALADAVHEVYWLEEAGAAGLLPSFAQLTRTHRADLVVVGGGYLGLWTALLAKRRDPGRRVVLLEAQTIGWAASGRNGGFCEASITHGEENGRSRWPDEYDTLERLAATNFAEFGADVEDLGLDCQWEATGVLTAAVEEHQLDWLGPEALTAEQARAVIDSPLFIGGELEREGVALVQPARLVGELARAAAAAGVEIFEHSAVTDLSSESTGGSGGMVVRTARAAVHADQVVLATNVFPSLLKRNRLMTVPVYDYVVMTEPLSAEQKAAIGWAGREGLADLANQFHYVRLSADDRILYGGYDAIYHAGGKVRSAYEDRAASYERLTGHLLATFPQLEGIRIAHRWAGAIDTSTQFTAFYGRAHRGRVAYAAGFTGLGVGATRFAAQVLLDLIAGEKTERTELEMVRRKPLPFPPEPAASIGINLTRWSLDRADHREGRRNLFLRSLDRMGLGFDS